MHINNGKCHRCRTIIGRFPNFHKGLSTWFYLLQAFHEEAHVSWGGRGKADQEAAFLRHASRAHYGQSAHNYNVALDIFRLLPDGTTDFSESWYEDVIPSELEAHNECDDRTFDIYWYGEPGCSFPELPHVEVSDWKTMAVNGTITLVEPV